MGEFLMPSLGADMTEGRVVEWLVAPGDAVHRGDTVATVDTSKAEIDIEVFEDGVVEALLVPVGDTVTVGTPLARISGQAEAQVAPPPAPHPEPRPVPPPAPRPEPHPAPPPEPVTALPAGTGSLEPVTALPAGDGHAPAPVIAAAAGDVRVMASPAARRAARELGVDLSGLHGTGPHGSVCRADVERAAALQAAPASPPRAAPTPAVKRPAAPPGPAPAPPPARDDAAGRTAAMREAIARLMARSKREVPHYYLSTEIDMTRALRDLEARNAGRPSADRLLPAALLLAATARAARAVPALNGLWIDDRFQPADAVHLGVAIALRGGGLVAPAIHDADTLPAEELMRALRDLVHRARAGRLRGAEMRDPTLTVTNLGDQGVHAVFGVIYPPQVALVGFGRITERPWAHDGMVGARPVVTATLSGDHRASDGLRGAQLLSTIDRLLQTPEEL